MQKKHLEKLDNAKNLAILFSFIMSLKVFVFPLPFSCHISQDHRI